MKYPDLHRNIIQGTLYPRSGVQGQFIKVFCDQLNEMCRSVQKDMSPILPPLLENHPIPSHPIGWEFHA